MKAIKAIVKQKLGIDPTVCTYCGSPDLVTEIVEPTLIMLRIIDQRSRQKATNKAPPKSRLAGLGKWVEV